MLEYRPFDRLGTFSNDWLSAHYHFSFADYHDHSRMGEGALRVWNDDRIEPHSGFPPHGHRDMEIITYVREGVVTHQDSLGNTGKTAAGQVQVMSAGSGITHAEYNEEDVATTLFQIWIHPNQKGLPPRWETKPFPRTSGSFEVLASGVAEDQGVPHIYQDARVLGAVLDHGQTLVHQLRHPRAYLVAAVGTLVVNGLTLGPRDGVAIQDEEALNITTESHCELVLVETV